MREYREGLEQGAEPHLRQGEHLRVLALAQLRFPPWLQYIPYGIGVIGFIGGLIVPAWLAIAMVVIAIAGVAAATRIPRRMLVRTDERLYVFRLPAASKPEIGRPLEVYPAGAIPVDTSSRAPRLDGVALYAGFGASGEKEAIAMAIAPELAA